MDDQNKNLILATVLSVLVILVWFVISPPQQPPPVSDVPAQNAQPVTAAPVPTVGTGTAAAPEPETADTISTAPRVKINTPRLSGSISLAGGRIDDLLLNGYRETLDADSDNVTLFRPAGEDDAYYTLFGWAPGVNQDVSEVPGPNTLWDLEFGTELTTSTPIQLIWDNGKGLVFRRKIEIDADYLFSITQEVKNSTSNAVRMAPYSEFIREGRPSDLEGFFVIHEGAIRQTGRELNEFKYNKMTGFDTNASWGANADVVEVAGDGWVGFTDHYWMTTLVPANDQPFTSVLQYIPASDFYLSIARLETQEIFPGQSVALTTRVFAGAKEWQTIRNYENEEGIFKFIDSIDWGWYFFLTKPIFAVLHWLNGLIGNMGWSIIALTITIKALLFPLAYKSYVSMARMKELQPEMEALKEKAGDDKQKLQKGIMELYKTNKVNPASGCLPILLQIPIFFSLYKVIFVTLELRQASWIGWIRDLSAPDPSSILNLFGLLPNSPPDPNSFLFILSLGVLPIILGVSMWLQQKLNPTPTDPTQQMIFAWMPWVFMFMLGRFASGLVLYWITNNTITFTQQYIIMRSHGSKPDVFGNIVKSFKRKKRDAE